MVKKYSATLVTTIALLVLVIELLLLFLMKYCFPFLFYIHSSHEIDQTMVAILSINKDQNNEAVVQEHYHGNFSLYNVITDSQPVSSSRYAAPLGGHFLRSWPYEKRCNIIRPTLNVQWEIDKFNVSM